MGAELSSLPGLGARSPLGGTAFGTTAHTAGHGVVHDTFMTLPAYTRERRGRREQERTRVHELGLGVRSCFHSARSDPWSATRERMERACPATSAEVQLVAHLVGVLLTYRCHSRILYCWYEKDRVPHRSQSAWQPSLERSHLALCQRTLRSAVPPSSVFWSAIRKPKPRSMRSSLASGAIPKSSQRESAS